MEGFGKLGRGVEELEWGFVGALSDRGEEVLWVGCDVEVFPGAGVEDEGVVEGFVRSGEVDGDWGVSPGCRGDGYWSAWRGLMV